MTISFVGAAAGDGTSLTIPGSYVTGDLMMMFAVNMASTTIPSLPAGWFSLGGLGNGTSAYRLGYKYATSNAETSGTWTNATGVVCQVFNAVLPNMTAPDFAVVSPSETTGTSIRYQTTTVALPKMWFAAFAVASVTDSSIETAPNGMVNVLDVNGATAEYCAFNTARIYPQTALIQAFDQTATISNPSAGKIRQIAFDIKPGYFDFPYIGKGIRPHPFSPGLAR